MKRNKAIFIDRDGTLIEDKDYLKNPDDVVLIKGAIKALKLFKELNYKIIVISNQSGVARGYFTINDVNNINNRIKKIVNRNGIKIDAFYFCPHYEDGIVKEYSIKCDCRKPSPGLIYKAQKDFNISLENSYVIGDKNSDIELAQNAHCGSILVLTGYGNKTKNNLTLKPDFIASDILEASKWIELNSKKIKIG